ncbi:CAF17-like 4Fe-4S cluster assembly/insertion protein YgfZ [Anthocerotibacter panamensis]|uniref:CAF17-like 4Fe-4S cluster assembly/insertion protein YgfZ n=1 Tax=Anthocerotibacter panamensis TaxID=2857077 RepID=UPI001C403E2F|nr:glycine cleavage T C-terminal barrel domain-containing protein [Anthocerotibacter panamensis]
MKGWFCPEEGLLKISGADSRDFLHRMVSCNVQNLKTAQVIPGTLLNALGRPLAPFWCWGLPEEVFLLQTPAACLEALAMRLERYVFTEDVTIAAAPGRLWQLVGYPEATPQAEAFLTNPEAIPAPGYLAREFDGVFWSPTDEDLSAHWQTLGYRALSPEEAECHRIEQGQPAWGKEILDDQIPLGMGWDRAFDHNKGCYPGQEVISRLTYVGHPPYQLLGVKLKELFQELPATLQKEGESIGFLTSCTQSETLGLVGLVRVRWGRAKAGDSVKVAFGEKVVDATIFSVPFGRSV